MDMFFHVCVLLLRCIYFNRLRHFPHHNLTHFFCNVHFLLLPLVVSRFSQLTSIMLYLTLNLSLTCGPICFITPYAPLILLCVVGTALLFVESHLVFYRHSFTPPILFPCLKIYHLIFPRYKYIKVISSIESY